MTIHTPEERARALVAGRHLGEVLDLLAQEVRPGVSTHTLEDLANEYIKERGDTTAFLGYTPDGAARPYPATLCVSVNDEVVHGIPNESPRILAEGDIVTLDLGLVHEGFIVDSALTVAVGRTDQRSYELVDATRLALEAGIAAAKVGNHIGDISHAIETAYDGTGFSIVKVLGGHGVGAHVHEEPWIANVGHPGTGEEIVSGMVLALEPIANMGKGAVVLRPDGYTYATRDGSRSAHFEHTILVEDRGTTVLTRRPSEAS
ncbi:MAG TPA: type I methionyl aminopeptidase [Candidatus Paceibacterota bacterium]|nr:type I methionyl aminopeptidase [Candidatus Paceibacterota bacterium]